MAADKELEDEAVICWSDTSTESEPDVVDNPSDSHERKIDPAAGNTRLYDSESTNENLWVVVPDPIIDQTGASKFKCDVSLCNFTTKSRQTIRKHLRKHKLNGDPVKG